MEEKIKKLEEMLPGRHDQQRLENLITKADGNLMKAVDLFYGISSSKASSKASHAKPSPSQKKNGKAPVPSKSSPASTILR